VELTSETAGIDIADGRTAIIVNVSDQKAYLVTERQQDSLREEAGKKYAAVVDRYLSAVRARVVALEGLDACKTLYAQLLNSTYEAADQFAARIARFIPRLEVPRLDAAPAPGK